MSEYFPLVSASFELCQFRFVCCVMSCDTMVFVDSAWFSICSACSRHFRLHVVPPHSYSPIDLFVRACPRTTKVLIEHLPAVRKIAEDVLELVFTPRAIARQFVLAIALETGALTVEQLLKALRAVSANFSSRARLIRQLCLEQSEASTQDDWMDLAERIDSIQGNDLWRSEPDCPLYEADRISARIDELVHLMRRRDIFDLMFVLRGGIARNKFGLLHEGLFSKALAGSKMLVETYHNVVCGALDFVCDAPVLEGDEPIPTEAVSDSCTFCDL
jgi:hypothetical protein